MNAVDSSVIVAAFSSWHEHHEAARLAMAKRPHLPAHAAAEAYSVLTRLPSPYRASPGLVHEFLASTFGDRTLQVDATTVIDLLGELAQLGIVGGASYDGLIGQTARAVGATLLTLDQRARETYDRLGVRVTSLVT